MFQVCGAKTILVIGDSISAAHGLAIDKGWVALLQKKITSDKLDYQFINTSITGDTTNGGLSRIDQALSDHNPAVVIIELGGNDGLRGIPPQRMKANLDEMITRSQAAGARILLLGMRIPPNYGKRFTELFYQVYQKLARQHRIAFVPFFLEGIALDKSLMQSDGIHPNEAAQPILRDKVWAKLKPLLD